jgi:DNA-directed RNA polymerase specialized sigma24 family protein
LRHPDNTPKNDGARPLSAAVRFEWKLTETAFNKLLSSLSPDREEAANRYELLRRKLIRFCESNTSVPADEGADEIINRVTRKLDEGALITNVFAYSFGVAKMVLKEFWKERDRSHSFAGEFPSTTTVNIPVLEDNDEARLRCFDRCLDQLSSESRKLIMDYYREDRHAKIELRKELAQQLSIPLNALRIRVHRLRKALEECCKECLATARSS